MLRGEAELAHAFGALVAVRGEDLGVRPVVVGEQDVADDADVAVGDAEALADDGVVVAGGVADEDTALARTARRSRRPGWGSCCRGRRECCSRWRRCRGATSSVEGVEELLLATVAGEPLRLVAGIAEVEAGAAVALREDEEVDVVLGADDLQVVGEAVSVLDEHAREEVVLRILVQLDAERLPDLRAAAVGADDDAAAVRRATPPS